MPRRLRGYRGSGGFAGTSEHQDRQTGQLSRALTATPRDAKPSDLAGRIGRRWSPAPALYRQRYLTTPTTCKL